MKGETEPWIAKSYQPTKGHQNGIKQISNHGYKKHITKTTAKNSGIMKAEKYDRTGASNIVNLVFSVSK